VTRRSLWVSFAVLLAVAGGGVLYLLNHRAKNPAPPNILLIVLDDVGYNDLGVNGNPEPRTPHLNALAAQGIRFTRHYADASCSVARAALMTGNFPAAHGFRPAHLGLSSDTPTIASALRAAGYRTQHIGKWHIGNATLEQSPSQSGFDDWFGFLHNLELGGASSDGVQFPKPSHFNPWLRDNQSPPRQYPGRLDDILARRAITFLEQQQGHARPWFLNLWFYSPHSPIQPDPGIRSRYPDGAAGAYRAMIEQLDMDVGRVLQALERTGQADNTLVVVLSDNGGVSDGIDSNYPFFGKKTQFFEGGVRTPLFMRWPGRISAGAVSDEPVSLYDIFPTLAAASGATPPPGLVGRNLLDPDRGAMAQLYWEYLGLSAYSYSILSADGRWRLTQYLGQRKLNDLAADPSGREDVLQAHPEVAAQLTQDYRQWRMRVRNVDVEYQPLDDRGGAVLRGDDLQRSPGYAGFTFAIGATPAADAGSGTQVIAEQSGRWRLQSTPGQGVQLDVLGQTLRGPALGAGQCTALVVSTHFEYPVVRPKSSASVIQLFVDGRRVDSATVRQPALMTWGYANPTYIGVNAQGREPFAGRLSRPIILNERVVPDDESSVVGNGISDVPNVCGRD